MGPVGRPARPRELPGPRVFFASFGAPNAMVERKIELKRRRHRRAKMFKLKARLAAAKDGRERDQILAKIRRLSPFWKPAAAGE